MSAADKISTVIDLLVRRLRLVRALEHLVRSAFASAVLLCLGLAWDKFQPLPVVVWQALFLGAVLLMALWTAWAVVRPVSRFAAARLADVRLGLEDRLGSACEFAGLARPTPFMQAHISETSTHLDRVSPGEAAPFRLPGGLGLLGAALVVMCILVILPGFSRGMPAAPEPEPLPALRFAGERTVDAMLRALDLKRDHRLADVMRRLKSLYATVRAGEISREEALRRVGEVEARLGDVESRRSHGRTAHTWRREMEKALSEKGAVLRKNPTASRLGRSMADLKLDEASRESRSLADRLTGTPPTLKLTAEQSKALAKFLGKAAAKKKRTLDTLSRQMETAARKLALEELKAFAKSLGEMARELDRLKAEMEKLKGLARVDEELEELKEVVGALRRDASSRWVFGLSGSDRSAVGYLALQGVDLPKGDGDDGKPGVGSGAEGSGAGGESERTAAARTARTLPGVWGEGDSLIEIIKGAAAEGVATTAYKDVAETAAGLAEDAVHNEDIPLGYRFYIKRYFQLIRPPARNRKENP